MLYIYFCSLSGYKPFVGDRIEEQICKGLYHLTKPLFSYVSNSAQDVIKQLLIVDYNMRSDFDKILKHIWFEKDVLMKQKVNDLITEYSNNLKSSAIDFVPNNKENVIKKIRFCPCLTHTTTSDLS